MRVSIVTPTRPSRKGNWITASRWRRLLRLLGHRADIEPEASQKTDLLVALHAHKSFDAIERFHRRWPERPLIVALTGTDLYGDLDTSEQARQALRWADRVILLQEHGLHRLPAEIRAKSRVIRQSAVATASPVEKSRRTFDVCVIGHLRGVKDPFRAAEAARLVPESSRLRIVHAGGALEPAMERRALREMAENPRYVWLGNRPQWQVRRLMKRSHLMALTSQMEGGANVVSEAFVAGTAVLSTRISGSIGMLGEDHPGYFEVGDTEALASLLVRAEDDAEFLRELEARSRRHAPLYEPERELEAWRSLLAELRDGGGAPRLFVYGSLQPGGSNEHVLAAIGGRWQPATVRGRLLEAGWGASLGYPGLVLDETAGEVRGYVFSSPHLEHRWAELDDFEGEEYERVAAQVTLGSGERVEAQVYAIRAQVRKPAHTSRRSGL